MTTLLLCNCLTGNYDPSHPQVRCKNVFLVLEISHFSISIRISPRLSGRDPRSWVVPSLSAVLAKSSLAGVEMPITVFGV